MGPLQKAIEKCIQYRIPVVLVFFFLQFVWFFQKESFVELGSMGILGWISLTSLFLFWLLVLIDMARTKIFNRTFWLISMFIFPWLAPAVYLFQRKKIKHQKSPKFRTGQSRS